MLTPYDMNMQIVLQHAYPLFPQGDMLPLPLMKCLSLLFTCLALLNLATSTVHLSCLPLTLSCFFVLHCLTTETSEGEGGRIGEGERNKGEEEVGIDLSDFKWQWHPWLRIEAACW